MVAGAAAANEVDLEGAVTELQMRVEREAAFVIGHPEVQPALVSVAPEVTSKAPVPPVASVKVLLLLAVAPV